MIKYLVIGDWIRSENDGQRHYVNADRLVNLYGLDPKDCKKIESYKPMATRGLDFTNFRHVLYPLHNGKYREHIEKLNNAQYLGG